MNPWFTLLIQFLPTIEQAIEAIMKAEGVTHDEAVAKLIDHNTSGQPNSPALA